MSVFFICCGVVLVYLLCWLAAFWVSDRLLERAATDRLERVPDSPILAPDGSVYMDRWWLLKPRWWTLGWSARLHLIAASDMERQLHDHPWHNVSWLLPTNEAGYFELVPALGGRSEPIWPLGAGHPLEESHVAKWRHPGDLVVRHAGSRHRLLLAGAPVWTIFITGPRIRKWGFMHLHGWRAYDSGEAS